MFVNESNFNSILDFGIIDRKLTSSVNTSSSNIVIFLAHDDRTQNTLLTKQRSYEIASRYVWWIRSISGSNLRRTNTVCIKYITVTGTTDCSSSIVEIHDGSRTILSREITVPLLSVPRRKSNLWFLQDFRGQAFHCCERDREYIPQVRSAHLQWEIAYFPVSKRSSEENFHSYSP